jgi:hypothetical protein
MSTLTEAAVDATLNVTAELARVEQQLQLRDRLLATTAAKLGEAQKANAAWRVLAERARKHLTEATHSEDCSRTDECDEADPGECGQCPGPCQPCDCGLSPIQATAGELYAALADPNLGADWVPRSEMEEQQRQYAENLAGREQQYQAELRRVSEAVQLRCVAYVVGCGFVDDIELRKIAAGMMATDHVDLGAIVRGGK